MVLTEAQRGLWDSLVEFELEPWIPDVSASQSQRLMWE